MPELTLQLYSARHSGLNDSLEIIAAAGYKSVEAYGENLKDPDTFNQALQAHGLTMASAHIGIEELLSNLPFFVDLFVDLSSSHLVCPYLMPERRPTDSAGWVELANSLNRINTKLANHSITFAWHNHDFEFDALPDGSIPMQLLLDNAPDMQWEIDIGWVVRAGLDSSWWMQEYANRISAIHLKDVAAVGECANEDGWADVGFGIIDWPQILNDIKNTSARHYIVEHDNPSNLKRFAENSYTAIQGWSW